MGTVIGALRALPAFSRPALMIPLLPPFWLIRFAVAAVWLYEGLWCKLLGRERRQLQIVEAVPRWGPRVGARFLKLLGAVEVDARPVGVERCAVDPVRGRPDCSCSSRSTPPACCGRGGLIHEPAGMVVKNFAFLVLVWVSASLPG